MRGRIILFFNGGTIPHFCFLADSDQETEALQKWVEENLSGRALALAGSPSPAPGPATPGEEGEQLGKQNIDRSTQLQRET